MQKLPKSVRRRNSNRRVNPVLKPEPVIEKQVNESEQAVPNLKQTVAELEADLLQKFEKFIADEDE